jgi:hypothetical protein
VAATLVFSALILTNLALFAAASQRERMSLTANSESLLADTATVLGGTKGLSLLDSLQNFLSSSSFQCRSAAQELGNYTSSLSATGSQDGVSIREALAPGDDYSEADNLTILKPFNGSVSGSVNVDLVVSWTGVSPLQDVKFNKTETHHLHLPVRLGAMTAFCEYSVGQVQSLLEGRSFASCNSSEIGSPLKVLWSSLESQAAAGGLAFSMDYSVDGSFGCSVSFGIVIEQPGVTGPGGDFTVRLDEGGTVSVRVL